ncbi:hypothetical protein BHE97_06835 [Aeromicrobium sp. PE09-221]|nr:hypothetical protein BHE97_06835 [Aeromicrobium sp. PE09-221]
MTGLVIGTTLWLGPSTYLILVPANTGGDSGFCSGATATFALYGEPKPAYPTEWEVNRARISVNHLTQEVDCTYPLREGGMASSSLGWAWPSLGGAVIAVMSLALLAARAIRRGQPGG